MKIILLVVMLEVAVKGKWYQCDCFRDRRPCMRAGVRASGFYNGMKKCNGYNDCGDWSDEKNCAEKCGRYNKKTCDCNQKGTCPRDGLIFQDPCYSSDSECDGKTSCGDWSDKRNCSYTCASNQYECNCRANGGKCAPFKDEIRHCYNENDKCNGYRTCVDWTDEQNCTCSDNYLPCGCILNPNNCTSHGGCVRKDDILNDVQDCADNSYEACDVVETIVRRAVPYYYGRNKETTTTKVVVCRDAASYSLRLQLSKLSRKYKKFKKVDKYSNKNRTVINTQWWYINNYYNRNGLQQCENKGFVITPNLCNGFAECSDGSDEMYDVPGFKCRALSNYTQLKQSCVLPQVNLLNNNLYCQDTSDICFVDGKLKCFRCLDKKLMLSPKQVCDGVIDCYDMSDECLCENQTLCIDVLGESRKNCPLGQMLCNNECVPNEHVVCNKSLSCDGNANLKYCMKSKPVNRSPYESIGHFLCPADQKGVIYTNASACDGIPECYNREDECGAGCPIESHFCKSDITCHHEEMSAVWQRKGLIFLLKREYCNGRPRFSLACGLGFDETNCTGRYYCNTPTKNFFSIEKLLLCDGVLDCDDGSDEWESVCNDTRFYCKSKQPLSVARERVENGIKDCSDGSDECPANSKKETVFSSPFEMIGNPVFRVILWIMGGISLLGNTSVCIISIMQVRTAKSEPLKVAFLWLVANLSVSDLLMGVYLLSVSAMGSQFSGSYCYYDAEWRSSQTCSILGSLAVVSTEVSALIMATMATIRLVSVYFPVRMSSIKRVTYAAPIVCAWCVGILIGTLPLANYKSGYFVESAWFPNYFFMRQEIGKTDMEWLANRVHHFLDKSSNKDWFGVKETITSAFQELPIKGEFGYFSETNVCMPRLFAKVGDAAWGYSTFIIVFNFCLFVYMAGCYLILYQRSRKVTKVGKSKSRRLL